MTGGDANASPVIDNSVVLEDLFYLALRESVIEGSQDDAEAAGLKRDYTLALTLGTATRPDTMIDECMDDSSIYSETDSTIGELSSFQARYSDFLRPVHAMLGYYTILGDNFLFREAGGVTRSYTGTIHLVTIGTPDIPAVITDPITIATETAERCIAILSRMLKG